MNDDDYYIDAKNLICSQRVESILSDALNRYMARLPVDVTADQVQNIIEEIHDNFQSTD
jgi:hypothetical protein